MDLPAIPPRVVVAFGARRPLTTGAVACSHAPIDVQEFLDTLERLLPLEDDEAPGAD